MMNKIERITKDVNLMRLNTGLFTFVQYLDGTTQESHAYETRAEALLSWRIKEVQWQPAIKPVITLGAGAGKDHGKQVDMSGIARYYETIPSKAVSATVQIFERHNYLVNRMGLLNYRRLMTVILCNAAARSSFIR